MKIPTRFKLLGETINVNWSSDMLAKSATYGVAAFRFNEITLQKHNEGSPIPQDKIERTFMHELIHHALNAMAEDDLAGNEKFFDVLAGLLHQALTTAEYGQPITIKTIARK